MSSYFRELKVNPNKRRKRMKFRHACPIAVALLTATVNLFGQTAPVWTQVSMPYYFAYGPSPSQTQPPASGPYNFYFTQTMSQGVNDQLGCYWNEFAPDYWFNGGTLLSGPIVRTAPAVGTQFQTGVVFQGQIRGIEFKGSFTSGTYPAATTYGNIGAFYYTGNQCLGGTLEYGFAHDYQGDSTNFYWSNHDNCPAGGSVVCRQTSNPADPTVASCGSGLTLPAAYSSGNTYIYHMYVFPDSSSAGGYKFRVEVLDPNSFAVLYGCTADPSASDPF